MDTIARHEDRPATPAKVNGRRVVGFVPHPHDPNAGTVLCAVGGFGIIDEYVTWNVHHDTTRWIANSGHYFRPGVNGRDIDESFRLARADLLERA